MRKTHEESFSVRIKESYEHLRSIYVGSQALERLTPGTKISVLIQGDDQFAAEGTLSPQGLLSGMAALYKRLGLQRGAQLTFVVAGKGPSARIIITSPTPPKVRVGPVSKSTRLQQPQTVFASKGLRHVHLEPFRPENLNNWEPESEADVYLAFGILQDYTDYQYCCAASRSVLDKLGANPEETAKPDAILIDRTTGEYLMGEWKRYSSDFKLNHKPSDIDVLVCWHDNETERSVLPRRIVVLHTVAKEAAQAELE